MQIDGAAAAKQHTAEASRQIQRQRAMQLREEGKEDKAPEVKLSFDQAEELTKGLNEVMNSMNVQARFSVHEKTHNIMVAIVNIQTGEVIREIPPRKILDMVGKMMEMVGMLIDEKA